MDETFHPHRIKISQGYKEKPTLSRKTKTKTKKKKKKSSLRKTESKFSSICVS
jgi:hypothetical protein